MTGKENQARSWKLFTMFKKDRLWVDKDSFFDPIKHMKLAMFETSNNKTTTRVKGEISL